MKVQELFEATADEVQPITVTAKDNAFTVSTKAKSGRTLDAIYKVFKDYHGKRGMTTTLKSGLPADPHRMFKNRPNGFIVVAKDPEGVEDRIKASIEKATAGTHKQIKSDAAYKAGAPARKKEASKLDAQQRKTDLAAYAEKYGKGTWGRVTYKQEGGDDGYQYVVRVDGRSIMNGLTRRSAEHEKLSQVDAIAKREKLGKYAAK